MIPWIVVCQTPLFMEFSRQEYWNGLPFLSPGDLPNPGIEHRCPALQADSIISQSLFKLMSIKSRMPFNHLIFCHPLLLLPSSFPASGSFPMSQFFTPGGQRIGVSASAISPSNEYSGLISFRMGWLDLLAVQGTL